MGHEDMPSSLKDIDTSNSDRDDKKKRKRCSYDSFARSESSSTGGRGRDVGWVRCPLCPSQSKKRFACGRGISAHLHAVHTPWNPSKSELKNRERMRKKLDWMKRQCYEEYEKKLNSCQQNEMEDRSSWIPTTEEIKNWGLKVLELTALSEAQAKDEKEIDINEETYPLKKKRRKKSTTIPSFIESGSDRTGCVALSYKESLPPFIRAASNGNCDELKQLVSCSLAKNESINDLIYLQDRNASTAEHWAAGGGHIECLKYLLQLKKDHSLVPKENEINDTKVKNKNMRRRDGKTPLLYAARNGHLNCLNFLMEESKYSTVDLKSGDGTTPLHMACYGGKLEAIKLLIDKGADFKLANAWGCNCEHWIAMSINTNHVEVINACKFLYHECKLPFSMIQKQGHSPLHKAAQRKNLHIIKWIESTLNDKGKSASGRKDDGGNKPSDILESLGGDKEFVKWMREVADW